MARAFNTALNETHQPKRQGPKLHLVDVNVDVHTCISDESYKVRKAEAMHDAYLAETKRIRMKELIAKYKSAHTSYRNMRNRCKTLGIDLGNEFSNFPQFLTLMGPVPNDGDTLDRIDFNGPYKLENVRWADKKTQSRNRSNVIFLEFKGVRKPLVEWAEETGQPSERLHRRIALGWTDEEIITGDRVARQRPIATQPRALGTVERTLKKLPWPDEDRERWEITYQRDGFPMSRIEFGIDHCVKALKRIFEIVEALPPDYEDYSERDFRLAKRANEVQNRCASALKHFKRPGFARFLAIAGRLTKTEEEQLNKTFGPHMAG